MLMDTTGNAALHILQNLQFAKCGLKTTAIELRYFGIIALIQSKSTYLLSLPSSYQRFLLTTI